MGSTYGEHLKFTIFGQSHGPTIGVTAEGLPAGFPIDMEKLQAFLDRRAPGRSPIATSRQEDDRPQFLSGLVGNVTCGAPLTAIIPNRDVRPGDYDALRDLPRPGHGDYPAQVKWNGFQDCAGGGHFSGRLTAPLCIIGGICKQLLQAQGILIAAHIASVGGVEDRSPDSGMIERKTLEALQNQDFPVLDDEARKPMEEAILHAKSQGDSIGGSIRCYCLGLPPGLGEPMFGGLENKIAQAVFGIPGIRGIEFGAGFRAGQMTGSQHNDPYYMDDCSVKTRTNHHGGILGGLSTGMPLVFRVAVKPTASIAQPQKTVRLSTGENVVLSVPGRHDPCIVPRAVACVEAAAAVAIYDALLGNGR